MNLLFVYRFCGLGGVETSILNKLDALNSEGIRAHVLFGEVYGSGGAALARDPRVTITASLPEVRSVLQRGFDAIAVIDHPDFIDLLEELQVSARVIFETHASLPAAVTRFHRNLNHPRVAAVVVPSAFNKRVVDRALTSTKPVVVVPNAVDRTRFHRQAELPTEVISMAPGGPILLWIGRLEDEKNPADLIRIARQALATRPDLRVLIVGDAFSDAEYVGYRSRLKDMAGKECAARLMFRQSVPYSAMPAVYSMVADNGGCLVSTSRFESAPMTFLEAMACECPVVSSDVGGVRELISDRETGCLYQSGDLEGAVAAVGHLMDEEHATARRVIVANGLTAVEQRHSPKGAARAYRTLVDSLPVADESMVPGLVSTIIPVHNRESLLREAVASVLAQTYKKIEIIIVDDGSTDGTGDVCDQLAGNHAVIRVLHIPHVGRAGLAREAGRLVARGEYIQYLDSDDLLMPEKFAVMVEALESDPNCDIAYCYTRRYRIGTLPDSTPAALTGSTFATMLPGSLSRRYWETSTPLYRRRLCEQVGAWSDLLVWEDIEYDVRIAARNPRLVHCKQWLTDMRDHNDGRLSTSRLWDDADRLREVVRGATLIYQQIKELGLGYGTQDVRSFVDDVRLFHDRANELGLLEEARSCADIVMDATGIREPLLVGEYVAHARVEPQLSVLRLRPGEAKACPVLVVNEGTVAFHGGECATELAYHLRHADGTVLSFENSRRVLFDHTLRPGESRIVNLWILAPDAIGLYYVELDILWAQRRWLNSFGGPRGFVKLLVGAVTLDRGWRLQLVGENAATLEFLQGEQESVRLAIQTATTTTPWHVQLNHEGVSVVEKHRYVLKLQARADRSRHIAAALSRGHEPWDGLGLYREIELSTQWQTFEIDFTATATDHQARVHFDAGGAAVSFELRNMAVCALPGGEAIVPPPFALAGRVQMDFGVQPLSYQWGTDRGLPVHRYYLEQFLREFASDVSGRCLEFQDPQYVPRFGGAVVTTLDILHIDGSNPLATLTADLTKPNDLPSDAFDCIVCTHVLHTIVEVGRAIAELCRMLKPGGVLLVAVPHISMYGEEYQEIWRFTPKGLNTLLSQAFGSSNVLVRSYGNSLTAAGEIRGVVSGEFLRSELDAYDERFPIEVCARAVKPR